MPVPNYILPEVGELNSIADPKVRNALQQILAALSGGIGADNLDPGLIERTSFVGEIRMGGITAPPQGWLVCDGRAISRAQYQRLYQAIGIKFGAGDNATTFNLPDLRDAFVKGIADGQPVGTKGGAAQVTLTSAQSGRPAAQTDAQGSHVHTVHGIGAHSHGGATHSMNRNAIHNHSVNNAGMRVGTRASGQYELRDLEPGGAPNLTTSAVNTDHEHGITADGAHSHGMDAGGQHAHNIAAVDAAQPHENRPPFVALSHFIYAGV